MERPIITEYILVRPQYVPVEPRVKFDTSDSVAIAARKILADSISVYETMLAFALDRSNSLLAYTILSTGSPIGTMANKTFILKFAIDVLAQNIIIVHNHPSGNLNVSSQDTEMTTTVRNVLESLDLKLVDSIILSGLTTSYYSFDSNRIFP